MSVYYAVTATLPTPEIARDYLQWLRTGHIDQVRAGGASEAVIVRLDPPSVSVASPVQRIMTHYRFPSREAFERYERDHAPALREDGRRRFGNLSGVSFERAIGSEIR